MYAYLPLFQLLFYNRANKQVAILCNHQRSVPKKHDEQMDKLEKLVKELEKEEKLLKARLKAAKKGKPLPEPKKEKKDEEEEDEEEEEGEEGKKEKQEKKEKRLPTTVESIEKALERLQQRIKAKKTEQTSKVTYYFPCASLSFTFFVFKKTNFLATRTQDELKTIALGTSKINYLDPRITAAWCKKMDVPIEKIFSKTLRDKFPWAMDVDSDWIY